MSETSAERRRFHRIHFDAAIRLSQGQQQWSVELLDISLKGLLVKRPADWSGDAGQAFKAQLELDAETCLEMDVRLTRDDALQLGFICQHIDLDSISHLRRLVELNLGDASLLERDLAALGGL